jgi:hypothetical protein
VKFYKDLENEKKIMILRRDKKRDSGIKKVARQDKMQGVLYCCARDHQTEK